MIVHDYNGTGFWSPEAVQRRYKLYARRYGVPPLYDLSPRVHQEGGKRWVYPVIGRVIECIETGDLACAEIGVEFIEESASFLFGMILKSNTARALRRGHLTDEQKDRIRARAVRMLCAGYLPREYRHYAKLVRKIGIGDYLPRIEREANLNDAWVKHYYDYFKQHSVG